MVPLPSETSSNFPLPLVFSKQLFKQFKNWFKPEIPPEISITPTQRQESIANASNLPLTNPPSNIKSPTENLNTSNTDSNMGIETLSDSDSDGPLPPPDYGNEQSDDESMCYGDDYTVNTSNEAGSSCPIL